jgi:hypothetical protein
MQMLLTGPVVIENSTTRIIPLDIHGTASALTTRWASDCIQSPLGAQFIYMALNSSARSTNINPESFKWLAVAEVNKLLSNTKTGTNDTTIATVLMLLAHEESDLSNLSKESDEREWCISANNAHLNGLKMMIQLRGGLAALGGNRCLQTLILMYVLLGGSDNVLT